MARVFGATIAVFLTLILTPDVEARPRDDVMSAAAVCNTKAGARAWLDCYYNATASMRASLMLTPLPSTPMRKAATMTAGELDARDRVLSVAYGCTNVAGDRAWLDCYYGAAQPLRVELDLSPAPQSTPAIAVTRAPEGNFGVQAVSARPLPTANHIVSRMASYRLDAHGIFNITLANGQVWQQIDGDTYHAQLTHPPATYVVRINHGIFGSYNVLISGVPGLFRAHRVS